MSVGSNRGCLRSCERYGAMMRDSHDALTMIHARANMIYPYGTRLAEIAKEDICATAGWGSFEIFTIFVNNALVRAAR